MPQVGGDGCRVGIRDRNVSGDHRTGDGNLPSVVRTRKYLRVFRLRQASSRRRMSVCATTTPESATPTSVYSPPAASRVESNKR
jgi:hypothetical protein